MFFPSQIQEYFSISRHTKHKLMCSTNSWSIISSLEILMRKLLWASVILNTEDKSINVFSSNMLLPLWSQILSLSIQSMIVGLSIIPSKLIVSGKENQGIIWMAAMQVSLSTLKGTIRSLETSCNIIRWSLDTAFGASDVQTMDILLKTSSTTLLFRKSQQILE